MFDRTIYIKDRIYDLYPEINLSIVIDNTDCSSISNTNQYYFYCKMNNEWIIVFGSKLNSK